MHCNVGVLGRGVVGRGLIELIERNGESIRRRTGVDLSVKSVLVRDPSRHRPVNGERITTDPDDILRDPEIDLVVEVMGGLEPARSFALDAIDSGKHVVTANKLMLARSGGRLFEAATKRGARVGFEASVCGGLPIIRVLSEGLVANTLRSIVGIVNGTCNYVLHQMENGRSFEDALADAQAKGFAEADPTMDIDGQDAAQKLAILARLAFGLDASPTIVEGIRHLDTADLRNAKRRGFVVRHVAVARCGELRVHPAFLSAGHPLAAVREENNALLIDGDAVGEMLLVGKGAGSLPTASAVLSDVLDIALGGGASSPAAGTEWKPADFASPYYLRIPCAKVPGVAGLVTTAMENHGISLQHVDFGDDLVVLTEPTAESRMRPAYEQLCRQPVVRRKPVMVRVMS